MELEDELTKEQAQAIQQQINRIMPEGYLHSDPEDYIRADKLIGAFDERGLAKCRLGVGCKLRATMALAHSFYVERQGEGGDRG